MFTSDSDRDQHRLLPNVQDGGQQPELVGLAASQVSAATTSFQIPKADRHRDIRPSQNI